MTYVHIQTKTNLTYDFTFNQSARCSKLPGRIVILTDLSFSVFPVQQLAKYKYFFSSFPLFFFSSSSSRLQLKNDDHRFPWSKNCCLPTIINCERQMSVKSFSNAHIVLLAIHPFKRVATGH